MNKEDNPAIVDMDNGEEEEVHKGGEEVEVAIADGIVKNAGSKIRKVGEEGILQSAMENKDADGDEESETSEVNMDVFVDITRTNTMSMEFKGSIVAKPDKWLDANASADDGAHQHSASRTDEDELRSLDAFFIESSDRRYIAWEWLQVCIYVYNIWCPAFRLGFAYDDVKEGLDNSSSVAYFSVDLLVDLLAFLNLFVSMRLAYEEGGELQVLPRHIWAHYKDNGFWGDAFALLPIDWLYMILSGGDYVTALSLRLIRLAQIKQLLRYALPPYSSFLACFLLS